MHAPESDLQSPEMLRGVMDQPLSARTSQEFDSSQDLGLKGRSETLRLLQRILPASCFEILEARDPELAEELEHPGRPQSRDGKHLQNPGRHLGPQGLEPGCGAVLIKGTDRLRQGDTHAWDLLKPCLGDHVAKRHVQQLEVLGRGRKHELCNTSGLPG